MSDALQLIGTAFKVGGTLYNSKQNSAALDAQGREATRQGYLDEAASRRESRAVLGAQAAAIAQAGIGNGGTTELIVRESELNAEMDALNYRYRGLQQGRALKAGAKNTKKEGYLLAGAQLLQGAGEYRNQRSILSNAEK